MIQNFGLSAWLRGGVAAACLVATPAMAATDLVYFGSHGVLSEAGGPPKPPPPGSPPNGIYLAHFDDATGKLTAIGQTVKQPRPTGMVANPEKPIVYALNELGDLDQTPGEVVAYAVARPNGDLTEINRVKAGGRGTTFLAFDAVTQTIFAANYASGNVSAIPVKPDGSLGEVASSAQDEGTGPNSMRQRGPHAHAVAVDPSHHFVLTPDLGADRLYVRRFNDADRTLSAGDPPFVAFAPGTGPRHLVFSPNGKFLFVDTELNAELHVFGWDAKAGHLSPVQTISTVPAGFKGYLSAAEIGISADGKFLYISNRSDDTLDVYSVNAATGKLAEIQRMPAQGKTPWSFAIDPTGHWMLVTDESSNSVVVLKIDPHSGKLSATGETMSMPHPASATFAGG